MIKAIAIAVMFAATGYLIGQCFFFYENDRSLFSLCCAGAGFNLGTAIAVLVRRD